MLAHLGQSWVTLKPNSYSGLWQVEESKNSHAPLVLSVFITYFESFSNKISTNIDTESECSEDSGDLF